LGLIGDLGIILDLMGFIKNMYDKRKAGFGNFHNYVVMMGTLCWKEFDLYHT
jgi:hypothetical protein